MKKRIAVILAALVCAGGNVCFSRYDFGGTAENMKGGCVLIRVLFVCHGTL